MPSHSPEAVNTRCRNYLRGQGKPLIRNDLIRTSDYLDAVLHIFTPELRERYRLEVLWGEAERLDLDLAGARGAA